jgi:dinuclear metal center YbgI/SA1388 family protein
LWKAAVVAGRDEIVAYANALLEVERWPEFAPPGLQVVGREEVALLLCGVSSSRELFERAAEEGADMVLVHHGLFWRNEPLVIDRRQRRRLEALFHADASLLAYHLALDAHPTLGNAARLAARIGASPEGPFGTVGLACTLDAISIVELTTRVREAVHRDPLVFANGPEQITRLAVSTGAAGYDLIRAAHEGFDALLTGEPEEPNLATAQELGIHLIAAGHHATERLGVQALAAHLADTFAIEWRYLEVENPV